MRSGSMSNNTNASGAAEALELEEVLITHELARRPYRPPDHARENRALALLAQEMASNPAGVLDKVVALALELCRADSAGVSIVESDGGSGICRWHAAAGALAAHRGGTMPREDSPCGVVIERNEVLLFDRAHRYFPALRDMRPQLHENLLAPLHRGGEPVGALWAIAHGPERKFDAEDARLLVSLARLAAAAHQASCALIEAQAGREELERRVEERSRALSEADERLRASEERFRHAMNIGTVGVLFFRLDGRMSDANAAFERMTGYTRDELLACVLWEALIPPEFKAETARAVEELARRGETAPYEKEILRKDGSRLWGLCAPTRLAGSGRDSECVEFVIDITEHKRAEARLRDSEERFRTIVENARDYAIFTTDPQDRITGWFAGAAAVFGWTTEEAIGRSAEMLFTPEDRAAGKPEKEIETARAQGTAPNVRWHRRKDGALVFIEGTVVALREPDGRLRGFLKIGQDVTERCAAEEALRHSEALFRTLATSISQLVFRSQRDGWRVWGSPQWIKFTGLGLDASVGFGWLDAVHPDDRETTLRRWAEAAAAGEYYVEHRVRRERDGAYRWHQTRARPLNLEDGPDGEWVGTMTDIHDLRALQEQQRVLIAELQHRTRNLMAVVSSIAQQTVRSAASLDDFSHRFAERLAALSRVQGLLSRGDGARVTLGEVVRAELAAHGAEPGGDSGSERIEVAGPEIGLSPRAVQSLALALHELATNALKYGALKYDAGRLSIIWSLSERDGAHYADLRWSESGVPLPDDHSLSERGFGRRLIERALPYDLGAETEFRFAKDGVRCRIVLPIGEDGSGWEEQPG